MTVRDRVADDTFVSDCRGVACRYVHRMPVGIAPPDLLGVAEGPDLTADADEVPALCEADGRGERGRIDAVEAVVIRDEGLLLVEPALRDVTRAGRSDLNDLLRRDLHDTADRVAAE